MTPQSLLVSANFETLARLSAGLAHDFNNVLQLIQSAAVSLDEHLEEKSDARGDLDTIMGSAKLAGTLVSSFLTVFRDGDIQADVLDVNEVVEEMKPLLERWSDRGASTALLLSPGHATVKIPLVQMEQLVLNLFLNAVNATSEGDTITIETGEGSPDDNTGQGPFVRVTVRDTGCGIDEKDRDRIFDPFFSSKEGSLSGLGLAAVRQIVEAAGGAITFESTPRQGSAFHLYLPACDEPLKARGTVVVNDPRSGKGKTILLVEDELGIGIRLKKVLGRAGYRVLLTRSVEEAEDIIWKHHSDIDLVVTDVLLGPRNGIDVSTALNGYKEGVSVIYMSGQARELLEADLPLGRSDEIITKPFDEQELLEVIYRKASSNGSQDRWSPRI